VTQTSPFAKIRSLGVPPTLMLVVCPEEMSIRLIVPSSAFAVQTEPAPRTIPAGPAPVVKVFKGRAGRARTCQATPAPAAQTSSAPTATASIPASPPNPPS
jgi:hypothetical protein